jgi:hypothetical protein
MKFIDFTSVVATCIVVSLASFSSPAYPVCSDVRRAKCQAKWRGYFSSEQQCIAVWSLRNGPSGRGCGEPGGQYKRCPTGRSDVPLAVPKELSGASTEGIDASPIPLVAPPRSIQDITAILDSEHPDPNKLQERTALAEATPPAGASREQLAKF